MLTNFIIFSKTERKISYTEFNEAVTLMAKKKYPGDADGVGKLIAKMTTGKGPQVHGVTVSLLVCNVTIY